ncbi:pyridoxamine 5'-phosphate oxidase family protein [Microbacterium sp. NEAU-LLC]|uniref:Pyridoxamine 5'-phosphate oxidase family protein n=1 Tax=Microbacterium helvum TaxID=2773713 RepID=A0ABR8NPF4_9MICO|nr:pyridoxamine 5'-phosphate oxidase family protein [Microbacterium helvum]MBD3940901.1 pyridoxamine 5'-phosphate oxidase family protein [Microbacterium helvum]
MPEPRDRATRKADLIRALTAPAADVWVATASPDAVPHLVPLSLAWIDERAVIALDAASITARNLLRSGVARLAVGPTRDVAVLDVSLDRSAGVDEDAALGEAYAAQADWDPRGLSGYVFLVLRPTRIQAWRESNELSGRVLMRDGAWVV